MKLVLMLIVFTPCIAVAAVPEEYTYPQAAMAMISKNRQIIDNLEVDFKAWDLRPVTDNIRQFFYAWGKFSAKLNERELHARVTQRYPDCTYAVDRQAWITAFRKAGPRKWRAKLVARYNRALDNCRKQARTGRMEQAIRQFTRGAPGEKTGKLVLRLPDMAENRFRVRARIRGKLAGIDEVRFYADTQRQQQLAVYRIQPQQELGLAVDLRLTGAWRHHVVVIARAGNRYYRAEKRIRTGPYCIGAGG